MPMLPASTSLTDVDNTTRLAPWWRGRPQFDNVASLAEVVPRRTHKYASFEILLW